MEKISIIIPIYNTKEYLKKCLDSVISQSYKNIEIICIDDGSTDGSDEILAQYMHADSRIRVIHKDNGGLVSARKTGINAATGKYAGYVDSDDWIETDMYETLYRTISSTNTDIVTCGYFLEGNYTTIHLDNVEEGFYEKGNMDYLRDNTIYQLKKQETGLRGGLWCKLFKTEILKKVQNSIPDEISIAEDKICLLHYILECSSAYVLRRPLYHWNIRENSMSHEAKNTYLLKIYYVQDYLTVLYGHTKFTESMRTQAEIYIMELLVLGINQRLGFKNKNMMWIDPYWMDIIPIDKKIILYGAGELGEKYKKQLGSRPDIVFLSCVDFKFQSMTRKDFLVESPQNIKNYDFDYIVITIKNKEKAMQVKKELVSQYIKEEKIIWCGQPEVYWKYVKAEGLIQE